MLANHRGPFDRRVRGARNGVMTACAVFLSLAASGPRPGFGAATQEREAPAHATVDGPLDRAGRVIEKGTGKPIAGASVTVRRQLWPDPIMDQDRLIGETKHQTDGGGNFRYTIPPEQLAEPRLRIIIGVEHPDYPPDLAFPESPRVMRKNEALGERYATDIELSPGQPITGTVETPDGKPAAGIKVKSSSYYAPEAKPGNLVVASISDTLTDDRGRFRFVSCTPGEVEVSLYPERFAMSVRDVRDNQRGDLGRFVLEQGFSVTGKVFDAGGKPLANVVVNAAGSSKPPPEGSIEAILPGGDTFSRSTLTDAKGEFALPPLPAGTYRVGPVEWTDDALLGLITRPLPAPFAPRKLTLKGGEAPAPLEFRPIASVTVEARVLDAKGRPSSGLFLLLGGGLPEEDKGRPREPSEFPRLGESWLGRGWSDATGKLVFHAPRGLTFASISLDSIATDEHHVLRHRMAKDAPPRNDPMLFFESLDQDVKGIEIISYESPILLVQVAARDGSKPREAVVTAIYPRAKVAGEDDAMPGMSSHPEIRFSEQDDGRFRSRRLLPDEEVTVTARARGFAPKSATFTLPEASIRAVELILDEE